jgi:hypothetical protein
LEKIVASGCDMHAGEAYAVWARPSGRRPHMHYKVLRV